MNHLSQEELHGHADGLLSPERELNAASHVRSCDECRARFGAIRALERALRSLPLESAAPDVARIVLARLGVREAPSWIFTLLKNVAPLFALTAVLVVVYIVLGKPAGAADARGAGESARGLFQMADGYTAAGVQALNAWMGTYFSFATNSVGLMGFLVFFFGGIALLDRFVVMPRFRKRV